MKLQNLVLGMLIGGLCLAGFAQMSSGMSRAYGTATFDDSGIESYDRVIALGDELSSSAQTENTGSLDFTSISAIASNFLKALILPFLSIVDILTNFLGDFQRVLGIGLPSQVVGFLLAVCGVYVVFEVVKMFWGKE